MLRLIVASSIFVVGVVLYWSVRRLRASASIPGQRPGELSLESVLTIGQQKRLLSVTWKGMDLLIADSGTSVELLSSTILRSAAAPRSGIQLEPQSTPTTDDERVISTVSGPSLGTVADVATDHGLTALATVHFKDVLAATSETSRSESAEVFHA